MVKADVSPTFIPPMLATLVAAPFDDPDWLFEVKWDGFRVEAVVDGGKRPALDAGRAGRVAILRAVPRPGRRGSTARRPIVDGEVIALDEHGEPDFALLQARIKGRGTVAEPNPFLYEVFDLLHLDGRSLIDEPLEERRRLLAAILRAGSAGPAERAHRGRRDRVLRGGPGPGPRRDHGQGPPLAVRAREALRPLAEGQDPPEQELVVGGWVTGTGKAVDLGALLVGVYEDGELRYAGKIGAGLHRPTAGPSCWRAVAPLAADASPFSPPPPARGRP